MATPTTEMETRANLDSLLKEHNENLLTCVHCGLCLPSCPTYRVLGNENDSPRGRIYLMRRLVEGQLHMGDSFVSHIDLCLGCRACETVCPSGVPYGRLLEAARVEVAQAKRGSFTAALVRLTLNHIFTRPRVLGPLMSLARWFRDSGLARLAFDTNLFRGQLHFALGLLLASRSPLQRDNEDPFAASDAQDLKSPENAKAGLRVALLRGCVMEGLFDPANRATRRVLARNGCSIVEAEGQMCCGALHSHAGEIEAARHLARKNIEAFEKSGCDVVVVNSAGCGAAMKEYGELLADDSDYSERAHAFASKVKDVSEFLIQRGLIAPTGSLGRRIAYDAPCHLLHAQRVAEQPVEMLKTIPGIALIPLRGYETCCGGAGIYNLQNTELSADILSKKIDSIIESRADVVVTANPGCIMQIGAGLLTDNHKIDVIHPIELLDDAYSRR